ncbi:unnamed protein product [Sphenostylis stenocarpa]|uniref:Ubiquitin-like domain-containing protein n=1 Tax=Sphenostylis stenocarpa TaxID=92480 RepID=A0AA87B6X3_9FABA|nr:unnamed protein product [Sphenostylis stenocarpa]
MPSSSSPERQSEFPTSQAQVRDLDLQDLILPPAPVQDLILPLSPAPVRDLILSQSPTVVRGLNLPPSPVSSPSLASSPLPAPLSSPMHSPLPPEIHQDLSPSITDSVPPTQPAPDLKLPTFLNKEYNPSDNPPWSPSMQLLPTSYENYPFGTEDFSSSPLRMSMPNTPSRVKEAIESVSSPQSSPKRLPPLPQSPSIVNIPHPLTPLSPTVTVKVIVPQWRERVRIESDRKDTVRQLKEKIVALDHLQGVPVDRIMLQLHSLRLELMDNVSLQDSVVSENAEIDVFLKPAHPDAGSSGEESGKLKVKVLPLKSNERIEIEVNTLDHVLVLREKLDESHQLLGFLPEDGRYFFIHRKRAMDEDQSFHWHRVRHGDTILTSDEFQASGPANSVNSSSSTS